MRSSCSALFPPGKGRFSHLGNDRIVNDSGTAYLKAKDGFALICCALLASLPFLQPFHSQPIPSFHTECLAILLGLLACIGALARDNEALVLPKVAILPLALACVVLLQLALGKFSYAANAVLIVFYLVWSAALACAIATLAQRVGSDRLIAFLCWALFISGIASAMCGFAQYAGIQQL